MKLLTKNTDYAIRVLVVLTGLKKEFLSVQKIAQQQKMPYEYLRKIVQSLIQYGLVESKSGGQGGIRLKVPATTITVADVIQFFQGPIQLSECMFRKQLCYNRSTCSLRKKLLSIEEMVKEELATTTIAGLWNCSKEKK